MRHLSLLPGLLCLLASLPLQAAVYTYVDESGNRVFTDQPDIEGASRVEIREPNYTSMPLPVRKLSPPSAEPQPGERQDKPRILPYRLLRIALPEPDAAIRTGNGGLVVVLESEPELQEGHLFRIEFDGQSRTGQRSPVFTLDNLDRGSHRLAAEIIDSNGKVLERTPVQPVHIQRTSINEIDRRVKAAGCTDEDFGKRLECPLWYKTRLRTPPQRTSGAP